MNVELSEHNLIRIRKNLNVDIIGRVPEFTGSNTDVYFVGDKVLRVSVSEECNKAIYLASRNDVCGIVKCFGFVELNPDENWEYIDAALVERLETPKFIPDELKKICEFFYSSDPQDEDTIEGLRLAGIFDPELKQGLEFISNYSNEVSWDSDINEDNFMVNPISKKLVISDPMV